MHDLGPIGWAFGEFSSKNFKVDLDDDKLNKKR